MDNGYEALPITGNHALAVQTLPALHRDPFDRILIVAQYGGPVRQV
ncbi:type II toxin-antitoxin system VapC family toxin [Nitrospirillum amazonense]|nr:type II toxin-antitoxin system VapC family toxin [Nitrospirillum amazonense]